MSAYFLATKSESGDSADFSAGAQVVRQLVAFLIASKGYLDYVIWFAVNNIEKKSSGGNDSADVDVDLSPQVNTALRSEILYYTTSGIKESVRAVNDEIIDIPISGESEQVRLRKRWLWRVLSAVLTHLLPCSFQGKSIKFWSFNPTSFRNIRLTFGISDAEYIQMFGATTKVTDETTCALRWQMTNFF